MDGNKMLVKIILNTAIFDAFSFKKPKPPMKPDIHVRYYKKNVPENPDYVSRNLEYLSWDARKFMKKDNPLFCYYCGLLGMNAEYLSEKLDKKLYKFDNSDESVEMVDFLKVNTI
jgi:hypothetical protein